MKYKIIKFVGCFNIVKIRDVFFYNLQSRFDHNHNPNLKFVKFESSN